MGVSFPCPALAGQCLRQFGSTSSGAEVGLSRLSALEDTAVETLEGSLNTYRRQLGSFYRLCGGRKMARHPQSPRSPDCHSSVTQ